MKRVVNKNNRTIKVINSSEKEHFISESDAEMDERAVQAVKAAISKAKICRKPIAKYDIETRTAYVEYPDGRKVSVK